MANILVLGGAHIDRRGTISTPYLAGCSHPGTWHEEAGGGGFNAARIMARLNHHVTMVAPRGYDTYAEMICSAAEFAGVIDSPVTYLDRSSASYTAILAADGNVIIGFADMALYDIFSRRLLKLNNIRSAMKECDTVLMDTNFPAATVTAIAHTAKQNKKFLAALGISPAKVTRLKDVLPLIDFLFINKAEALELTQKKTVKEALKFLKSSGLRGCTISQGKDALYGYYGDVECCLKPPPVSKIIDATGAGDALSGATLSALIQGETLETAMKNGVAAAQLVLASKSAFPPNFNRGTFEAALGKLKEAKLTLNR